MAETAAAVRPTASRGEVKTDAYQTGRLVGTDHGRSANRDVGARLSVARGAQGCAKLRQRGVGHAGSLGAVLARHRGKRVQVVRRESAPTH
eukprot:6404915-Prymnesium_polylepis.1